MVFKSIVSLIGIVILSSCSSTSDILSPSPSPSPEVTIDGETYNWKSWDCYDWMGEVYILRIGYVPEISDSKGILFLKGSFDSGINTTHSLRGVHHRWEWDDYIIVIESDGTGHFYDFTGAKKNEERMSKETYKCYLE
jgi:hypothetical protein